MQEVSRASSRMSCLGREEKGRQQKWTEEEADLQHSFRGSLSLPQGRSGMTPWSRARGPGFCISGLPGRGPSQMSQPSLADQAFQFRLPVGITAGSLGAGGMIHS